MSNTNGRDEHSRPGDESDIIVFWWDAAKARSNPLFSGVGNTDPHEHCRGACNWESAPSTTLPPRMSVIPAQRESIVATPRFFNQKQSSDCLSHKTKSGRRVVLTMLPRSPLCTR